MNDRESAQSWRLAGLSITVLLLLILALYQDTVRYLVGIWNQLATGEYAHGYMVLAISGYLVFRSRRQLAQVRPCPSKPALLAVIGASLLWGMATLVDVEMAQAASLLLVIMAVVWAVLGNRAAWVLAFPILFIFFAVPIWFPISPLLQDTTADAVFWLIRALDVPAFREGNLISVPAGNLSIEEACSGLRYLLAALTLGTLFAYLSYRSFGARLLVVLVAAGSAILANILRVFIVVYLAYSTDMQHPWVKDHLYLGWYLFGGLVFLLLLIEGRLHPPTRDEDTAGAPEPGTAMACHAGKMQQLLLAGTAALLLGAGPATAWWAQHQGTAETVAIIELPVAAGGWRGPLPANDDWMPQYRGAISSLQRYQRNDVSAFMYIGYYPVQHQGSELINDLNRISDRRVWRPVYPRGRARQVVGQPVLEQLLENGRGRGRLVWYWYQLGGRQTDSRYEAKLLQMLGQLTGRPEGAVIMLATDIVSDRVEARKVLEELLSTVQVSVREEAWKK